jgi:hypothetical protein
MPRFAQRIRCPGAPNEPLHADLRRDFPKSTSCPYGCGDWPEPIPLDSSPPNSPLSRSSTSQDPPRPIPLRTSVPPRPKDRSLSAQHLLASKQEQHSTGPLSFMSAITPQPNFDRTKNLQNMVKKNATQATDLRTKTAQRHSSNLSQDLTLKEQQCQISFWFLPQVNFEGTLITKRGAGRVIRTKYLPFKLNYLLTIFQGSLYFHHSTGERNQNSRKKIGLILSYEASLMTFIIKISTITSP